MTVTKAFTDPSVTGPNFLFNTGQVSGATELYNPASAAASGGSDYTWGITQWSTDEFFTPTKLSANIVSPTLGTSVANWATADGENGFAVFGKPGNYTYQLTDIGGNLKDVYLATTVNAPLNYTFDKQVTFTASEGIAAITADQGPTQISNNFTVAFNRQGSPGYDASLPTISEFLQFPLADSRGLPSGLSGDGMYNVAPGAGNNNEALYFVADGKMHEVTIDVSAAVAQMAQTLYKEQYTTAEQKAGSALLDLSKWSLTSEYIGPESIGTGVTMDVSHPVVTRDDSISVNETTAAASSQVVTVAGGVNYKGQVNGVGPIVAAPNPNIPVISGIATTTSVVDTADTALFRSIKITDPTYSSTLTAVVSLSDTSKATFDISQMPTEVTKGTSLGDTVTLSADGKTVTISGSSVYGDLRSLQVKGVSQTLGTTSPETVTLKLTNSAGTTTQAVAMSITGTHAVATTPIVTTPVAHVDPGYWVNGSSYMVNGTAAQTATIDLTGHVGAVTVYGGLSALSYTGGNATIVLNGPADTGAATIHSTGGDVVWVGGAAVTYFAAGKSEIILGSTGGVPGTVNISGGTAADSNVILSWGNQNITENIVNTGAAATTLYGGTANVAYTGGDAVIVDNGGSQTGTLNIHSTGGNVVWAGAPQADLYEGAGSDTVVGGIGKTVIHGAALNNGGLTTFYGWNAPGSLEYDGGAKASDLEIGNGQATIFAGSATENISLSGSGTITAVSGASATGTQDITVSASATGHVDYWGGTARANLTLGGASASIQAGSGNTTLTGGSGSLSLNLQSAVSAVINLGGASGGNADVYGFSASTAKVSITDVAKSFFGSSGLVVDLANGHSIIFHGTTSHNGITFG